MLWFVISFIFKIDIRVGHLLSVTKTNFALEISN